MRFFLKIIFCLSCCFSLEAWNDTGHRLVAKIAEERLTPEAKIEVERLLALFPSGVDNEDMISAAVWADCLRGNGLGLFNHLHYAVIPYDPDQFLTEIESVRIKAEAKNGDVVWALEQCIETLNNPNAGDFEKGLALRLCLHLTADAHQPLHTTSLFSAKFPNGDMGGNLYKLNVPQKNLHAYWDNGAGFFLNGGKFENQAAFIQSCAIKAQEVCPIESVECLDAKPNAWVAESHEIAVTFCYQIAQGTQPDLAYQQQAEKISLERVATAGYRLASLLNQVFNPQNAP